MKRGLIFLLSCLMANGQSPLPLPTAGNVTLPLDEYNRLVEQASQPAHRADGPPIPHALKSAQLDLQAGNNSVTGKILFDGEVFLNGDRKVPLVSGMIVTDAQRQSTGVPAQNIDLPMTLENGASVALISGPSEFSATLDVGLPLQMEPGRASFNLPVPAAGTVRLTLTVPGEQTQVMLTPGVITNRSSANGKTVIEATLIPGQNANIGWASRLAPPPVQTAPKEVRFLSDIKTLISVTEGELNLAALAEVSVIQGEPDAFTIQIPEGYELNTATGPTLDASDVSDDGKTAVLHVNSPQTRSHQFLVSFSRANMTSKAEIPLITFAGTQRETGEVLVEGEGAMELKATERTGNLHRMDLKETSPYLQGLAHGSPEAAYRYQKKSNETPSVALEWTRFPDSSFLSAVAQRATITTLVTNEGRSLTEVRLTLQNKSQPFLKVALPTGATILSAEVEGVKVKPVEGADGNRVPLLRPGFRPANSYTISFVFLHAGSPFSKKGGAELTLPRMDIPLGLLEWEVFLPSQFKIADFGGNALPARLLPAASGEELAEETMRSGGIGGGIMDLPLNARNFTQLIPLNAVAPNILAGTIVDASSAVIPRADVLVRHASGLEFRAVTDANGQWQVLGVPSGRVTITASAQGFKSERRQIDFDASRGGRVSLPLQVGAMTEQVTVEAGAVTTQDTRRIEKELRQNAQRDELAASQNVTDFQRKVAGVLPIAVNVPRTGNAYRFSRPLVLDEETKLTFNYKAAK